MVIQIIEVDIVAVQIAEHHDIRRKGSDLGNRAVCGKRGKAAVHPADSSQQVMNLAFKIIGQPDEIRIALLSAVSVQHLHFVTLFEQILPEVVHQLSGAFKVIKRIDQ